MTTSRLSGIIVVALVCGVSSAAAASTQCEKLIRGCDGASLGEAVRQAEVACPCTLGQAELGRCVERALEAYQPRLPRRCRNAAAKTLRWSACAGGSDVLCELQGQDGDAVIAMTPAGGCLGRALPGVTNAVEACLLAQGGAKPDAIPRREAIAGARVDSTTYANAFVLGTAGRAPGTKTHVLASLRWSYRLGAGVAVTSVISATETVWRDLYQLAAERKTAMLAFDDLTLVEATRPDAAAPDFGGLIVCNTQIDGLDGRDAQVEIVRSRVAALESSLRAGVTAAISSGTVRLSDLPRVLDTVVATVESAPAGAITLAGAASRALGGTLPHGCAAVTIVGASAQAALDAVGLRCAGSSPVCVPASAARQIVPVEGVEASTWAVDMRTTFNDPALSVETMQVHRIVLETLTCNDSSAGTDDTITVSVGGQEIIVEHPGPEHRPGWTERMEIPVARSILGRDIDGMTVRVNGSDDWCIERVALYLNDSPDPVFLSRDRVWLGELHYSAETLRSDPSRWTIQGSQAVMCEFPARLTGDRIEKHLLAMLGDAAAGGRTFFRMPELYFGSGSGAKISRADADTVTLALRVNYRLKRKLKYAIDVDGSLTGQCDVDGLRLEVGDLVADASPASAGARAIKAVGLVVGPIVAPIVAAVLTAMEDRIANDEIASLPSSFSLGAAPVCPAISIPAGTRDFWFEWPHVIDAPLCWAGLLG